VSYAPVGDRVSGIMVLSSYRRRCRSTSDVMSGYITGDPYWLPDPEPSFLAAAEEGRHAQKQPSCLAQPHPGEAEFVSAGGARNSQG